MKTYLTFNPADNTYGISELDETDFDATGSIVLEPAKAINKNQRTLDEFTKLFPEIRARRVESNYEISIGDETHVLPWVAWTSDGTIAAIVDENTPIQKIGKPFARTFGKPTNFYTSNKSYQGSFFPGR
jgi:hypothetical protein